MYPKIPFRTSNFILKPLTVYIVSVAGTTHFAKMAASSAAASRVTLSLLRRQGHAGSALKPLFFSSSAATSPLRCAAAPAAAIPMPTEEKEYPEKITKLVDQIAELNLLEVSDLNALLKSKLNITDAPVMMAGGVAAPAAPAPAEEDEESASAATIQTSFTIKLTKFDAGKKVALIKELKAQVEGMNLVQAKKFVESSPAVVKTDIGKGEAEALKKALEAVGGECEIE